MASSSNLESHFVMLDGLYQFSKQSAKAINGLSDILDIPLSPSHVNSTTETSQDSPAETEWDSAPHAEQVEVDQHATDAVATAY